MNYQRIDSDSIQLNMNFQYDLKTNKVVRSTSDSFDNFFFYNSKSLLVLDSSIYIDDFNKLKYINVKRNLYDKANRLMQTTIERDGEIDEIIKYTYLKKLLKEVLYYDSKGKILVKEIYSYSFH